MRQIGEFIDAALAHRQAGRLDEAARLYEYLIKIDRDHHMTAIARIMLADIAFARAHGRLRDDPPVPERALAIFYRVSSQSRPKERVAGKERCLANFLAVFAPGADELCVIADNCDGATLAMIGRCLDRARRSAPVIRTALGNSMSWRHALDLALALPDERAVYFVEDDFLHREGARAALAEGLARADYVSLYDHPDKYATAHPPNNPGGNPVTDAGGEVARVIRTSRSHWKTTNSATMTFAATRAILAADRDVWDKYTEDATPHDFPAFVTLCAGRRSLIAPIPAFATHGEAKWLAPGVDWTAVP